MHVCVCAIARTCDVRVYSRVRVFGRVYSRVKVYVRVCSRLRVYVLARTLVNMCVCGREYDCACACLLARMCVRVYVHVKLRRQISHLHFS